MFKIPVSISVHYSDVLIFPLLRLNVLMAVNMKFAVFTVVLQFGHVCAKIMCLFMQPKDCVHLMYCVSNWTQFIVCLWSVHVNVLTCTHVHVLAHNEQSHFDDSTTAPSGLKL